MGSGSLRGDSRGRATAREGIFKCSDLVDGQTAPWRRSEQTFGQNQIVARFTEFTAGTTRAGLTAVARYAADRGLGLTLDEVVRLAQEGVDSGLVISLLQGHIPSIGAAELARVLIPLGGEYEKLSAANGKHPRVPATPANRALVARLDDLDIVSTHSEGFGEIRAHMRQPS